MINSYNALLKIEYDNVDENLVFGLSTWLSNYEVNGVISQKLNRNLFYIDKKVSKSIIFNCIRPKPYLSYPKSKKLEDKKLELVYKYLIDEYKFGQSDRSSMHKVISNLISSKEFVEEFASRYGLDNNERKTLGLKPIIFDKSLMKKSNKKSLLDM